MLDEEYVGPGDTLCIWRNYTVKNDQTSFLVLAEEGNALKGLVGREEKRGRVLKVFVLRKHLPLVLLAFCTSRWTDGNKKYDRRVKKYSVAFERV